jgi:hypothetical protein
MIAILLVTKNEGDLLELNLRHHLEWGIDRIAVADNDSTDATSEIVRSFGDAVKTRRFSNFHVRQTMRHEMLHELVDESNGALEWAAISDTDEFFWADVPLAEILARTPADVVAVNFDAKLYLPTALDAASGSILERRVYRTASDDSPLHTSYTAGKTFYRTSWLTSIPTDHWCKVHEHLCLDVPHPRYRPDLQLVHHYMIQDEEQFVEKVVRLIEWAKPPEGTVAAMRWRATPKRKRALPHWTERWKKVWWDVYQRDGVEGVRRYYRDTYVIPADAVERHVASNDLVLDSGLADYTRARTGAA